ncbi:porin [Sinirhodobacter sp. WL0062]|uniref:Porin n=1 Tax=Rhodobacter flavimaris TaxID=2907145 RepID=A0ABS8YVJ5_9RHOB|nr:porin [Sinirhodobacter sp. WL0062]MCE5973285.1 porin [Sinirhodobacter sp. WL0062]
MKKVLLATTALVFSAGFAAAEVTISGSANMGFKYDEGDLAYAGKKAAGWYEIDMDVTGTMESDSGLTFGATIELDSDYASLAAGQSLADLYDCYLDEGFSDECAVGSNETLAGSVFVSGAFGTFTVGSVDPVADDIGLTDIGFDGIGTDNVAEMSAYSGSADARWDYTVGAVTLGASVNTISEDYGLLGAYDFGAGKVALSFDHDEAGDNDSVGLLVKGTVAGIAGELYVADDDTTGTSWGVYGAYTTGALTLEASYADYDDNEDEAYGIGAKYALGGGAKLAGGVGSVGGDTVADLGVTFSF